MGLFTGVGDFFRGAFGESDEEKRLRKQREAQAAQARQQQQQAQQVQQNQQQQAKLNQAPQVKNVQDLFGAKRPTPDTLGLAKPPVTPPLEAPRVVRPPVVTQPKVPQQTQPAATPTTPQFDPATIRQKAMDYQKPKVQDVNNYYGNDLKALQDELAKGDKTDYHRVQGIMQSLDNRKKELSDFHKQRGDNTSFKSARELQDNIKQTRGNWDEQNQKLQQFWDGVSKNEKSDFMQYLQEKGATPKDQQNAMAMMAGQGMWKNGTGANYAADFSKDNEHVKAINQRQKVADIALQYQDTPLDQLNNKSIADYRSEFEKQNPNQQRDTMHMLEKYMTDIGDNPSGDKNLQRKLEQAYILHTVLDNDGTQRSNFGTRVSDIGAGTKKFGGALLESPSRVVQSIGALAGDDPGGDIIADHQAGKISNEEFDRKMNEYNKKNEWAMNADTPGKRLLTAAGTSADTVATFLPVASLAKGAKGAFIAENLVREGMAQGLEREAAKQMAKETLSTFAKNSAEGSLKRTMAEEALANGIFSGAGSLREGTFDPAKTLKETATGAVIGGAAPAIGSGATKLWRNLRGIDTAAPEALEDVGRVTSRLEGKTADELARDAVDAENILESKGVAQATEEDLKRVADNQYAVEGKRTAAQEELARRGVAPDTTQTPSFIHKQEAERIFQQGQDALDTYIADHPTATPEEINSARISIIDQTEKAISDLQTSRDASIAANDAATTAEGAATAQTVQAGQANAAEAAAQRTAETAPAPAGASTTTPAAAPAGSPEVAANNGYRPPAQTTDQVLYGDTAAVADKGRLSLPQLFSPDRVIRENITRPIENAVNRGVEALQTSGNRVLEPLGRLFTGFSREAGISPEVQTARMQLRGGVETGKLNRETIADLSKGFGDDSLNRVWATLDPEFAGRAGMEVPEALSPAEAELQGKLKTVIDNTTSENLKRGLITPEQAANGSYIKRSYSVYDGNTEAGKFENGFRQELLGQYKGRKQVSDDMVELAIKDPTYLVGKKTAESEAMWAMQDYGNFLTKNGSVSDIAKPGFTQLPDSPVFGAAAGKYIPQNLAEDFTGFQYNNAMVSAWNDLITAYDRLGIRQAKKQLLTVFNPAVRLGNQTTNRAIFSQLGGINPLQFNAAYLSAGKEIAEHSPIYREAVQQGLTGIDISQAEFFARRVGEAAGDRNLAQQALDWVKTSYSDADDKARIAAYMVKRNQGYSAEEAARQVQRSFQDYKSVGFFYDMAAKTPLIGNAFVRFASDSVRIAKNAAIDHPLRSMATIAAWSTFVNGMSVVSGESQLQGNTPEEKAFNLVTGRSKSDLQKDRENRFGAPKIPFTDISTAVQTPWGEVNVARFMPWYQLNDISGSQVSKFLPFQNSPITIENGKPTINGAGFNDPLLGQVVQVAADKDFRNKSIQDPNATGDKYRDAPLSGDQKRNNVLRYLFTNNAPLGKEIDQTKSAVQGQPDAYGKDRTVPQAILRDFGVKIEQQGSQQAKDRQATKDYFDEKAQIDKEVAGMSPNDQEAYKRLTGYYKLREQVPNEFKPGETRDKKSPQYDFGEDKWKDLAAHPELYKLLVDKKVRESQSKGTPLQPEFDPRLSESFRKQLLQNKMVAPGDDAELDQRMYSSPEWDYYQSLKKNYKDAAKVYYKDNGNDDFTDELVKHQDAKFPDKPPLLKAYSAAYKDYNDGKRAKPEFSDQMKALKEQYNHQTLDWTNKERSARGLPAITWDVWNNPTFGFDSTPSGSGFGFGGGGGSTYNPADHVDNLTPLTNYSADINPYKPVEAQAAPNIVQLFNTLMAAKGGGHAKPKLGASASGR